VHVILNWLWQGSAIAFAVAAVARPTVILRADARYRVVILALGLVIAVPLLALVRTAGAPVPTPVPGPLLSDVVITLPSRWWSAAEFAAALWFAWVTVVTIRLARALVAARHARHNTARFPRDVESRLRCWTRLRSTGRRVTLALSSDVRAAAVLGLGQPLIAVHPQLLELPDEDLDRVLVHEWAHVQRRDDIGNVIVIVAGVVAGWHPAVIWLCRRLQIERELSADAMAVAATGSAKAYASCLATLASLPAARPLALAVASSSRLEHRIRRVLSLRDAHAAPSRLVIVAGGVALCLLALIVGSWQVIVPRGATYDARAVQPLLSLTTPVAPTAAPSISSAPAPPSRPGMTPTVGVHTLRDRRAAPIPRQPAAAVAAHEPPRPVSFEARAETHDAPVPAPRRDETAADVTLPATAAATATASTDPPPLVIQSLPTVRETTAVSTPPPQAPWTTAADAGVAVGRTSQKAAVATAGFFTRVSKRVAGAF